MVGAGHLGELDDGSGVAQRRGELAALRRGHEAVGVAVGDVERGSARVDVRDRAGAPYTLRGYFRAPEHNVRAFTPDGFYRSGDLMRRHPTGNYVVAGRSKDLINRGGEKISAEEVENLILGHPAVQNVACIPVPDDVLGERMCACIVPRTEAPTLAELVAFLRRHEIAAFKLPERLEVLDAFPLSPIGKVSKRDLVARFS